jgi:hypothetical protein
MHIDAQTLAPPLPRGPRRTTSERLREELQVLAGGHALIEAHSERSWASITFAGTRHRLDLAFEGEAAIEAGERFIVFVPEHEFSIPRQLVADAAVTSVDHRIGANARMIVRIELLLLDE